MANKISTWISPQHRTTMDVEVYREKCREYAKLVDDLVEAAREAEEQLPHLHSYLCDCVEDSGQCDCWSGKLREKFTAILSEIESEARE